MSDENIGTQLATVRGWLDNPQQQAELAKVLPAGMDPTRFARIALTAVLRNPKLARCDKASFVLAIMEAAALGLEPDSQSGMAYLVPFGGTCQLIVGYRGLIQLAYRHPRVSEIGAEAVYDKDVFKVRYGINPQLDHWPALDGPTRGEFLGAYAWARVQGGGRPFVYMPKAEIEEHRARSRAKNDGPWITDYIAMAVKTPVRSLCKRIPQSPQLMQALAVESDPELEGPAPTLPVPATAKVEEILDAIAGEKKAEDNADA